MKTMEAVVLVHYSCDISARSTGGRHRSARGEERRVAEAGEQAVAIEPARLLRRKAAKVVARLDTVQAARECVREDIESFIYLLLLFFIIIIGVFFE